MEMIFNDVKEHVLELCALDKARNPPARTVERPRWDQIYEALQRAYSNGGFVHVRVLKPENSYINQLTLVALPNQLRLIALTRDDNPKNELLEWWEPGEVPFTGTVRFGDDEWDSRTVSSDMRVAEKIFHDLYEDGELSTNTLENFRSQWNPKPQ